MPRVPLKVYLSALGQATRRTSVRRMARWPLEQQAERLIASAPPVDLSRLTRGVSFEAHVPEPAGRHAWSLHASDQFMLQSLVAGRQVKKAFEIGTFNGGTTRILAEAVPEEGRVWTLDLPPDHFDSTQFPEGVSGSDVGQEYRVSPAAAKITQLLEDSMRFDPTPYAGTMDLVLVDGAHDYEHGHQDTLAAFQLVSPGGVIVWDDFQPYWHGLIRGIFDAAGPRRPHRLAGSNLGVWTADL